MSTSHSNKAKAFLKDADYVQWHDRTFWSVRAKRDAMASGLDEWEQLREKASAIKRHTLTHLDEYLERFAATGSFTAFSPRTASGKWSSPSRCSRRNAG